MIMVNYNDTTYIKGGNTAMRVEVSDVKDKLPELVGLIVSE